MRMAKSGDAEIRQWFAQALAIHQQGNLQEAARRYKLILDQQPDHADALHLLGVVAHQFGKHDNAINLIKLALKLQPANAVFHYNLAKALQANNSLADAITHYQLSLQHNSSDTNAWANLAVAYQDSEQVEQAVHANRQTLALDGDHPIALLNLGTLLSQIGEYDEAALLFDRLLHKHPMHAEAHTKKSLIRLLQGDFVRGWHEHYWMYFSADFVGKNPPRVMPFPKWRGEALPDSSTLLINGDQGVGDVVMFASLLPDVLKRVHNVVLECDHRLITLFQRSFPAIKIIPKLAERDFYWQQALGPLRYRIDISELASLFRNSEADFPLQHAYLKVDDAKVLAWQTQLRKPGTRLTVGISWRGGLDARARQARSIALAHWQPLAALPGVQLVNLQYGDHAAEIAEFNAATGNALQTHANANPMADLSDFAALVKALDLVISIDNTTVHIAGALNVKTWLLLPLAHDWRWLLQREDTPWYASLTLWRADALGAQALRAQLVKATAQLASIVAQCDSSEQLQKYFPVQQLDAGITVAVDAAMQALPMPANYALLLNDTSAWYHWGCSCTSLAMHAQLRARYPAVVSVPILDTRALLPCPTEAGHFDDDAFYAAFVEQNAALVARIRAAAVVVINGEGTLHELSQASLALLYVAYVAKTRLGKRVCVINHSCYPDGSRRDPAAPAYSLYRKVYAQLDFIAVREAASMQELAKMHINAVQSFDSLPLFVDEYFQQHGKLERQDYVVLAGSYSWSQNHCVEIIKFLTLLALQNIPVKILIGANAHMAADDIEFVQSLASQLGDTCELHLATSESEWLQVLAQARVLVSGRFHHTIAAAFLGTPFLVMGSNTPKIEGLLEMLEIDAFVDEKTPQLAQRLYEQVLRLMQQGSANTLSAERREKLLALATANYTSL